MFKPTLLAKEFRELRWALILGLILLTGMALVVALSYQLVQQYMDLAIGLLGEELARQLDFMMSSFDIYIWSQWYPKNLLQIGTILAIILGSVTIAGEVSRGSMDFLISRPVSRSTILAHKMLAGSLVLTVSIWLTTLLLLGLSLAQGLENWHWLLGATLISNLGLLVAYAFSVLISALTSDPVKAGAISGLILLVYSGLGLVRGLHNLSFFWHMKAIPWVLGNGSFPWLTIVLFPLIIAGLGILAAKVLESREL